MVGREICGPAKKIGSGPSHRLSQAPDRTEGRTRSDGMVNFILSRSGRMAFSARKQNVDRPNLLGHS